MSAAAGNLRLSASEALLAFRFHFKQVLTSQPALYGPLCSLRQAVSGRKVHYPSRNTQLCVEGYPSRGNTLARDAVLAAWPELDLASHRHRIASVRRAQALGIPVIILIRRPVDAISSRIVRFGQPPLAATMEYVGFYSELARQELPFVDFNAMLKDPTQIITLAAALMSRPVPAKDLDKFSERFQSEKNQAMQRWNVPPERWWVPNEKKDALKSEAKRALERYAPLLREAEDIYAAMLLGAAG